MSKSELNRAIATALRACGIADVRPMWATVQRLRDEGLTPSMIAAELAPDFVPPVEPKLANPTLTRAYTAPVGKAAPAGLWTKAKAKAPVVRKATDLAPSKRQHEGAYEGTLVVEGGSMKVWLTTYAARPLLNRQAGTTHDAVLTCAPEHGSLYSEFTLSPERLARLKAGASTKVRVNGLLGTLSLG